MVQVLGDDKAFVSAVLEPYCQNELTGGLINTHTPSGRNPRGFFVLSTAYRRHDSPASIQTAERKSYLGELVNEDTTIVGDSSYTHRVRQDGIMEYQMTTAPTINVVGRLAEFGRFFPENVKGVPSVRPMKNSAIRPVASVDGAGDDKYQRAKNCCEEATNKGIESLKLAV